MHHLRVVERAQPLLQAGDLDVVGLVAVLLQPGRIRRHEREPLDLTAQPDVTARRVEPEFDPPEGLRGDPVVAAVVVESAHPQPLLPQQLEVDVGDGSVARPRGTARTRRGNTPFSQIIVWPSQARSVVDSPSPAAA